MWVTQEQMEKFVAMTGSQIRIYGSIRGTDVMIDGVGICVGLSWDKVNNLYLEVEFPSAIVAGCRVFVVPDDVEIIRPFPDLEDFDFIARDFPKAQIKDGVAKSSDWGKNQTTAMKDPRWQTVDGVIPKEPKSKYPLDAAE